jgi:hypothetical protein
MGFISRRIVSGIAATQSVIGNLEKSLFFTPRPSKKSKTPARANAHTQPNPSPVDTVETLPQDLPAASAPLAAAEAPAAPALPIAAPEPPAPVAVAIAPSPAARLRVASSEPLPVATYQIVPTADLPNVTAFRSIAAGVEDPHEEFLKHMKEGKRPFRRPGISIKDEFDLWYAARTQAQRRPVPQHRDSGRPLKAGRNLD